MPNFPRFLASVFLGFLILNSTITAASAADRPNILLIFADDVGCDAIGCYGGRSYPTPHIDSLAENGLKFTHGFAMPVCHPSRMCLTTGRYPFRFGKAGSVWGSFPKDGEEITIGHRMLNGGYATAVAGKWQLCMMKDDLTHPQRLGFEHSLLFGWHEGARYHSPLLYQDQTLHPETTDKFGPDMYVEYLQDFIKDSSEKNRPFFAYYPMALCHDVTDDLKGQLVPFYRDGRWMTYAEMMSAMDDMVGRLLRTLDELNLRDNTLVLFLTDNGTAAKSYFTVNEEGKMVRTPVVSVRGNEIVPGGKGKFDDTGVRVPWIANWPGKIAPGTTTDRMVDLTDLLPTLADVAGLPDDGVPRDGISFASSLGVENTTTQEREWIFTELRGKRAVRSQWWKLYDNGRFYDLKKDPLEKQPLDTENLSAEAADSLVKLQQVLEQMHGPFATK